MSFQDVAKAVRAKAVDRGLTATMSRINDAIALACYGKKYAAVVAAEKAGKLGPLPTPPPNIAAAARRYHMDEHAFGLALRDGLEGPPPAQANQAIEVGMSWLVAHHPSEVRRLEQEELMALAPEAVRDRILADRSYGTMALRCFVEWLIAEGNIVVDGRTERVADLLLRGAGRPAWQSRERAFLTALSTAPLRVYAVERVTAGYCLTLRPLDGGTEGLVQVSERSASDPTLVGEMVAARVIPQQGRLELSGGLLSFCPAAQAWVPERVRQATSATGASRAIRSAWFDQFEPSSMKVVLEGTEEELRLVCDRYRCDDLPALAARLATDARVRGDAELGWGLVVADAHGRDRRVCSIHPADDVEDQIEVQYESEGRANTYRSWFETLVRQTATFLARTVVDPIEVAMASERVERQPSRSPLPPEVMTQVLAQAYRERYADFADHPLPLFEGATPREMLRCPGGERRVRELLALYERNERRMAQQDRRDPVDFAFLYQKLSLAPTVEPVATRAPGLHPDQFEVNEAWIAFPLIDEPVAVVNQGDMVAIGLIDAHSTCILNFEFLPAGVDFTELGARQFLERTRINPAPPRPPRHLFIADDVPAGALHAAAKRLGIVVSVADGLALDAIVGEARAAFGQRMDALRGGDSGA